MRQRGEYTNCDALGIRVLAFLVLYHLDPETCRNRCRFDIYHRISRMFKVLI